MGDTDLPALNQVLRWIRLEMTSPDTVRVLPDEHQSAYVRGPQRLLTITEDPNLRGEYQVHRAPQLERIIGAFTPLAAPAWRAEFARRPEALRGQVLGKLREEMQNPENTEVARRARILATTFYWNATKSLRLTSSEVRNEVRLLRAAIAAHRNETTRPGQEIGQNAGLALAVLLEAYPNAK
jgi:hypothetical protein